MGTARLHGNLVIEPLCVSEESEAGLKSTFAIAFHDGIVGVFAVDVPNPEAGFMTRHTGV